MTLTMSHSVPQGGTIFPKEENIFKEGQREISRPVAFRPHLAMGLALDKKEPSPRQARTAHQEQGISILRCIFMG